MEVYSQVGEEGRGGRGKHHPPCSLRTAPLRLLATPPATLQPGGGALHTVTVDTGFSWC